MEKMVYDGVRWKRGWDGKCSLLYSAYRSRRWSYLLTGISMYYTVIASKTTSGSQCSQNNILKLNFNCTITWCTYFDSWCSQHVNSYVEQLFMNVLFKIIQNYTWTSTKNWWYMYVCMYVCNFWHFLYVEITSNRRSLLMGKHSTGY